MGEIIGDNDDKIINNKRRFRNCFSILARKYFSRYDKPPKREVENADCARVALQQQQQQVVARYFMLFSIGVRLLSVYETTTTSHEIHIKII